jgi:uncharacterized protein (TIGR00369 family)
MDSEKFVQMVRRSFAGTLMEDVGMELVEAAEGRARARVAMSSRLRQPTGLVHAGALVALADTAATTAALSVCNPEGDPSAERFPLAVQLSANLVGNTREGLLEAEASVIHRGGTTMVAEARVSDGTGRLLAKVTVTLLTPRSAGAVAAAATRR